MLQGHEPCPALLVDRHWTLVSANRMVPLLLQGAAPALLQPPLILNLAQWRAHLLARLAQQIETKRRPDAHRTPNAAAVADAATCSCEPPGVAVTLHGTITC